MVSEAKISGITFNLQSGYRAYSLQVSLYNGYVKSQGQTVADRQSARPGHSEHQTGLAADLGGATQPGCDVEQCYADTPEGKWLAANGYKYGFIIRYPADKESVTGYMYEPWHIRYVGTEISTKMHHDNVATLEELFNVAGGTSY
jgi:D-alanyl-D-alanine carboxypeptidase